MDSEIGDRYCDTQAAEIPHEGWAQQNLGKLSLQLNIITLNFAVRSLPWNFVKYLEMSTEITWTEDNTDNFHFITEMSTDKKVGDAGAEWYKEMKKKKGKIQWKQ